MKVKVLVQILIIAILGTATVQAQENINREVKRDLRKVKREMRKVKKDLKKNMKDIHFDAIHFDEGEVIIMIEDRLEDMEDVLEDLDVEFEGLEFIHEYKPLRHVMELEHLKELEYMNIEMPEMYFDQGSVLELSKDLEDVSVSKDFFFDVEDGTKSINMNIDGALQSGDLTITVKKPDGELFQKFQISPLADVDWSQQIDLNEEESYIGKWTINLSGEGATGNYNLKFRAR